MGTLEHLSQRTGNTPLLHLSNWGVDLDARVFGKLEYANPTGSVKDRAALAMIDDAEARGILGPDSVIIEPTSGNTGIALASIAADRGYRIILCMPETMSVERQQLLSALGAQLELTPGADGITGSIERAEELVATLPHAWKPDQFTNPANPRAHFETTGPEIWRDTEGEIDILVAGVGSAGTITGTGRFLRDRNPRVEIVAVEPASSAILSGGEAGAHKIQGIGAGFVPPLFDTSLCDEVTAITDEEAFEQMRWLAYTEGLLVGISSGAALAAARTIATRASNVGKTIVVVLPDTGERYLSLGIFERTQG
ncbi:MAG: cysteine synthase A [Coriobacteriia bacterium]|nr:cysteine synthase A [Coriobacteriia bacterium]